MPAAIRRLGVFLFCLGAICVVAALTPVAGEWFDRRTQQAWLAGAMVGGLMVISGLVMDWLGTQALRDQQPLIPATKLGSAEVKPPAMRLSSRPAGNKGYREDLMA